ncbi:hypothetical protein [Chitinophaga tropicalis]|uniref:Uncharacterized protein n=1 Tax=Chitinophaga tropicalis TaxID=2683588 RepID=A0A7K1U7P6_9BACT|nr:hypothetical protein [Chitinophaga tropicalis]MVT10377.1 hypothetical protein [Chitinophaga tropicalis]
MKKARIVLSAVALFALIGGALAFKATRNALGVPYTLTRTVTIGGIAYSAAASFYTSVPNEFFAFTGISTTKYSTTEQLPGVITLTQVGGTATTTIASYGVTLLANTLTANVD